MNRTKRIRGLTLFLVSLLTVSACASAGAPVATLSRALGPGEEWLPVDTSDIACAGTGWPAGGGVLTGSPSDPRLAWMVYGTRHELVWPVGYSARFTPKLEVLDARGRVVGHDGDRAIGGCEMGDNIWQIDLPGEVP